MAKGNKKPILFISHISEEKEAASLLKDFFEHAFLGAIEVFVSSNEKSITYGARWLDRITNALQSCDTMLVLCSAKSVQRPWINFETGFGSARGVEVIPVCYAGQDKGQLPAPLSFYQGLNLRDAGVLELLLEQIAEKVNMHCPQADCAALAERIGKIEERYMFWDACNAAFDGLEACMPGIMQTLKQLPVGGTYEFEVEDTEENQIFKKLREGFFADGSILALSEAEGMTIYADYEVSKDYIVTVQQRFIDEIAGNEEFKYK